LCEQRAPAYHALVFFFRCLTLCCALVASSVAIAQDLKFVLRNTQHSPSGRYIQQMVALPGGGSVGLGSYPDDSDFSLTRYDIFGAVLWQRTIDFPGRRVANVSDFRLGLSSNGKVYFAASLMDTFGSNTAIVEVTTSGVVRQAYDPVVPSHAQKDFVRDLDFDVAGNPIVTTDVLVGTTRSNQIRRFNSSLARTHAVSFNPNAGDKASTTATMVGIDGSVHFAGDITISDAPRATLIGFTPTLTELYSKVFPAGYGTFDAAGNGQRVGLSMYSPEGGRVRTYDLLGQDPRQAILPDDAPSRMHVGSDGRVSLLTYTYTPDNGFKYYIVRFSPTLVTKLGSVALGTSLSGVNIDFDVDGSAAVYGKDADTPPAVVFWDTNFSLVGSTSISTPRYEAFLGGADFKGGVLYAGILAGTDVNYRLFSGSAVVRPSGAVVVADTLGASEVEPFTDFEVDKDGSLYWVQARRGLQDSWPNVLVKHSPQGIKEWERPILPTGVAFEGRVVKVASGGIVLIGQGVDADTKLYRTIVRKVNPDGTFPWSRWIGSFDGPEVASTASVFGDVYLAATAGGNIRVMRVSPTGTFLWTKNVNAGGPMIATNIAIQPDGRTMVSGFRQDNGLGYAFLLSSTGGLIKTIPTGATKVKPVALAGANWATVGDLGSVISVKKFNSAGTQTGTTTVTGEGTAKVKTAVGASDGGLLIGGTAGLKPMTVRLNSSLGLAWKRILPAAQESEGITSIVIGKDGLIYAGGSKGTADRLSGFVVKYSNTGLALRTVDLPSSFANGFSSLRKLVLTDSLDVFAGGISQYVGEATDPIVAKYVQPLAPVAFPDSYAVAKNTVLNVLPAGVLANDKDGNGDALSAVLVVGPPATKGTLVFRANGSLTFTPKVDVVGATSFSYRAKDTDGLVSSVTTVTITVK